MSEPNFSPPVGDTGARIQPRTLQRWLDVNRAFKLDRIRGYINLDAIPATLLAGYEGFSELVFLYRFNNYPTNDSFVEIPNNLTLRQDSIESVFGAEQAILWTVGYTYGVSAVYPHPIIQRYALNKAAVDSLGYTYTQQAAQYAGEPLPGYALRLEGWTVSNTLTPFYYQFLGGQLETSVLGVQDIMWADSPYRLGTSSFLETNFRAYNQDTPAFTLPFMFSNGTIGGRSVQYSGFPNDHLITPT